MCASFILCTKISHLNRVQLLHVHRTPVQCFMENVNIIILYQDMAVSIESETDAPTA